MELLLWLWLLDKGQLFGYKPNIYLYIFIWLIPILINISVIYFNFYFFSVDDILFQYIIFSKLIICFFSFLTSLILIKNLLSYQKKENNFFEQIKNISLTKKVRRDNYWVYRNSLINLNGIFLLIISLFHVFWSYYYINFGIKYNYYYTILLRQSAFFEIGFAIFVFIIFGITSIIKIISFITLYLCPKLIIFISKIFNKDNLLKLNFNDINSPIQEVPIS